jgi:serine phosphatase RsbU (regulator of sigma subunit)/anti-sigma regulatory factor (Ser/Thr protein kinase)
MSSKPTHISARLRPVLPPWLRLSALSGRPILWSTLLFLFATVAASQLLQERLGGYLVERVLASQRMKVDNNLRRLNATMTEAEKSVIRLANLISSADTSASGGEDLANLVHRDADGVLRTPALGFDAEREAALWIPPGVPLTNANRRFFVRALEITRLFGMGAENDLLVNSWVLPLTNGEVIFWPGKPDFVANAKADLDYRQTPWVQLSNPSRNPGGAPRWTEPEFDPAAQEWLISLVAPFRRDGRWAGSVGHDIEVSTLLRNLGEEQGNPRTRSGSRATIVLARPLYVVRQDGQILASDQDQPAEGKRLPPHFASFVKRQGGAIRIGVYRDGHNYLLVAPIPKLKASALYRVEGDAIRTILKEEINGLQLAEALVLTTVMASVLAIVMREAQHRRSEQRLLEERNRNLQNLVEERTAELESAHRRLQEEVMLASRIQRDLLVSERELQNLTPGLDAGALMVPSKEVGGDLYDCIALGQDRFLLCVGDVAGKGMPAALLMSTCLSLLRSYAEVLDSPAAIMRRLNRRLCHNNEDCAFTTLVVATLELRSGELRWCNAGHTPLMVLPATAAPELQRAVHGPALGVVETCNYGESRLTLTAGDGLLLFTDGLNETFDRQGGRFGLPRLLDLMGEKPPLSSRRQVRALMRKLREFADGELQHDDITMLLVRLEDHTMAKEAGKGKGGKAANASLHLDVANDLDSLPEVKRRAEAFCDKQRIHRPLQRRLMVVIDELLNNAIRHGCSQLGDQARIQLKLGRHGPVLQLEVRDNGVPPFNPLEAVPPDLESDLHERPIGGLGIHLVRSLSSHFDYTLEDGYNVIRVQIDLEPPASAGGSRSMDLA